MRLLRIYLNTLIIIFKECFMSNPARASPKLRTRFWKVITYPNVDEGDSNILPPEIVVRLTGRQCYYSYCLHDKDADENGVLKKPHYHWVIEFRAPIGLDMLCLIFGVNYAIPCRPDINLDYRYLLHLDDKDKAQYDYDCIKSNLLDFQLLDRLSFVAVSDKKINTDEMYDAVAMLAYGELTYREFYKLYPSWMYKPNALEKLMEHVKVDGRKPLSHSLAHDSAALHDAQRALSEWRKKYITNDY